MGVLETIVVVVITSAMAGLVARRCWRAATGRDAGCGACRPVLQRHLPRGSEHDVMRHPDLRATV